MGSLDSPIAHTVFSKWLVNDLQIFPTTRVVGSVFLPCYVLGHSFCLFHFHDFQLAPEYLKLDFLHSVIPFVLFLKNVPHSFEDFVLTISSKPYSYVHGCFVLCTYCSQCIILCIRITHKACWFFIVIFNHLLIILGAKKGLHWETPIVLVDCLCQLWHKHTIYKQWRILIKRFEGLK